MNIIEFKDVRRAYVEGLDVLKGITFRVQAGEVVGLLGRNGAGKTTLIRVAMGMLEAQSGSARLFGLDPRREPLEVKRRVGYVSEDQVLPPFLRVREVIALHRKLFEGWDEGMARSLVERFRLPVDSRISQMSKGQARQVALLCAVSHRPELLLLDEPASGLDPRARIEIRELLKELRRMGKTIMISSHILHELSELCDTVGIIEQGELIFSGPVREIMSRASVGKIVHIVVDDRVEAAAKLLAAVNGIISADVVTDDGVQRIDLTIDPNAGLPISELPNRLVAQGFRISQIYEEKVNLETAFMRLTKGLVS
jgi:ABC-2 type transport system ATP-binding protein